MADPVWREMLPDMPLRRPFDFAPLPTVESFAVEDGEAGAITGRRWSGDAADITAIYIFTLAEYDVFVDMMTNDFGGGAIPWVMRDPLTREARRFILQPGQRWKPDVSLNTIRFVTLPLRRLPA